MASAELIVDVHHHYMPVPLFDRLAAQAGGRRIVTNEISLTLNPSRKDLETHLKVMDEAGVRVSVLTDQVQVMGADVARMLNDGIAEVERKHPRRFVGAIHLPVHQSKEAERELARGINELGLRAVALAALAFGTETIASVLSGAACPQGNKLPFGPRAAFSHSASVGSRFP